MRTRVTTPSSSEAESVSSTHLHTNPIPTLSARKHTHPTPKVVRRNVASSDCEARVLKLLAVVVQLLTHFVAGLGHLFFDFRFNLALEIWGASHLHVGSELAIRSLDAIYAQLGKRGGRKLRCKFCLHLQVCHLHADLLVEMNEGNEPLVEQLQGFIPFIHLDKKIS